MKQADYIDALNKTKLAIIHNIIDSLCFTAGALRPVDVGRLKAATVNVTRRLSRCHLRSDELAQYVLNSLEHPKVTHRVPVPHIKEMKRLRKERDATIRKMIDEFDAADGVAE